MRPALPLLALLPMTGCPTTSSECIPPPPENALLPPGPPDLDILFLVDNSGGTAEMQLNFALAFPSFLSAVAAPDGTLPNLHVGVVSSSVDIAPFQFTGCPLTSDDGVLQNAPRGACEGPAGRFIIDVANPDGTRTTNYSNLTTLADVFGCISRLGSTGCGMEQHLESLRRALDGHRPENDGFLRPGAHLAVVIVADEDDCSAANTDVFEPVTSAMFGEYSSFRCAEFGYVCDGSSLPRTPVEFTSGCEPAPTSYLRHPAETADFLQQLDGPATVHAFSLVAPSYPVRVILDPDGDLHLDSVCPVESWGASATPGLRLRAFAEEFDDPPGSLCTPDAAGELTAIGGWLRRSFDPCLARDIDATDVDAARPGLQVDCRATRAGEEIPVCEMVDEFTPALDATPCWWVTPQCGSGGPTFHVESTPAIPPGEIFVECGSALSQTC